MAVTCVYTCRFKQDVEASFGMTCTTVMGEEGLVELGARCNLIVCATTSKKPLLYARHLQPGTHVTAMGADGNGKQELDVSVYKVADLVVADSKDQCCEFGDISCVASVLTWPPGCLHDLTRCCWVVPLHE